MFLSLKRTSEGALVLYARHPERDQLICLLDYCNFSLPLMPSIDYSMSLSRTRDIWMNTNPGSYFAEYDTLAKLGLSAAKIAAGWEDRTISSVSSEIELTDDNAPELKAYFNSLASSHGSPYSVDSFINKMLKITNDDPIETLFNSVWDNGILYAGPILRSYFQDAVLAAYASVNLLGDKAPSARDSLSSMYRLARANGVEDLESVELDMGLTVNGYKQLAPLFINACYTSLDGVRNQVMGACLVLKCLLAFMPGDFQMEEAAEWIRGEIEKTTKYKRVNKEKVIDLDGFFF
jgi:hypothetical protein